MIDQEQNYREVRQLFTGFDVYVATMIVDPFPSAFYTTANAIISTAIGKRITPHPATRSKPGNYHYCFVDLGSREEARAAMRALNGRRIPGGTLRVSLARGVPPKLNEESTTSGIASSNWRKKDGDQTQEQ
jgi:hypothetical protein